MFVASVQGPDLWPQPTVLFFCFISLQSLINCFHFVQTRWMDKENYPSLQLYTVHSSLTYDHACEMRDVSPLTPWKSQWGLYLPPPKSYSKFKTVSQSCVRMQISHVCKGVVSLQRSAVFKVALYVNLCVTYSTLSVMMMMMIIIQFWRSFVCQALKLCSVYSMQCIFIM